MKVFFCAPFISADFYKNTPVVVTEFIRNWDTWEVKSLKKKIFRNSLANHLPLPVEIDEIISGTPGISATVENYCLWLPIMSAQMFVIHHTNKINQSISITAKNS